MNPADTVVVAFKKPKNGTLTDPRHGLPDRWVLETRKAGLGADPTYIFGLGSVTHDSFWR